MNNRNQIQWLALLALAVLVPTASLLWFMSCAVSNERLVIRQKLGVLYGQRLQEAGDLARKGLQQRLAGISGENWSANPYGLLRRLVLEEHWQGVVLWDTEGKRVYPEAGNVSLDTNESVDGPLSSAWRTEFVDKDYASAASQYEQLVNAQDTRVSQAALIGQVRALSKMGHWNDALATAMKRSDLMGTPARLMLLSRLQNQKSVERQEEMELRLVQALENDLFKPVGGALPSGQNLYMAQRLLEIMKPIDFPEKAASISRLSRLADAEALSLTTAKIFPNPGGADDVISPVTINGRREYVIRHPAPGFGEMMIVLSEEGLVSVLNDYRDAFRQVDVCFRILDTRGNLIAGELGTGREAIVSEPLPMGFPEGRVEVFFADSALFSKAANRQIEVYIWTGILVILLILITGALAVRAVGRQIRLNRMKNDFIATVSHELKTPLASMRLLIDTLLEGRVKDEEQAREYLRMTSRENERLTRMIENFLTFSRMDRNKNAFVMTEVSPRGVAVEAIESVSTKFEAHQCQFTSILPPDLPDILADHDAMTTVLINLLDNACKYTGEDKRIDLTVSEERAHVCFAVSDNGVGLTKRQSRRIFERFYQADRTLARAAEGCGLGLSIVKFIVRAHHGTVDVRSQPGQGSVFTVRIPLAKTNHA